MLTETTPVYSAYSRRVSFDTVDSRDSSQCSLTSLTLNYKHKDYKASRHGRTYLCGLDASDYSEFALEWLIDELIEDGDEIVCLRIVDRDSIDAKRYQSEGKKLFDLVIRKMGENQKAICLAMELAVGNIQHLIHDMVSRVICWPLLPWHSHNSFGRVSPFPNRPSQLTLGFCLYCAQIEIYEPTALVVGTRGASFSGVQGLFPGSVSKHCLQQSPVPVIVAHPSEEKR